MHRSSRTSAGATYLNKDARIDGLKAAAHRARERMPSIQRVVLFGSLVSGIPTPRSDADLLVIVGSTEHASRRDRVPEVLRALSPLPCPVDVHVMTGDEFERSYREENPFTREVVAHAMDLLPGP